MGGFIKDGSDLPAGTITTRTNSVTLPASSSRFGAEEANEVIARVDAAHSALLDVRDHASGWVNVKSYGAKADYAGGSGTDNGPAIQAALSAAGAANRVSGANSTTVFIPAGQYRVVNPNFTIPNGVRIVGSGKGATRLYFQGMNSSTYAFKFSSTTDECWGQVEDLYIYAGGGNGIKFGQGSQFYSYAKNVEIEAPHRGIEITYTYGVKVENVTVRRAADWSFYIHDSGLGPQGPTTITIDHVNCEDWSKGNLYISGAAGVRVLNSVFEGASSPAGGDNVLITRNSSSPAIGLNGIIRFAGNWFETTQDASAFVNHVRVASDYDVDNRSVVGLSIVDNSFGGGHTGTTNADIKLEGGEHVRIEYNYTASAASDFLQLAVSPPYLVQRSNYGKSYTDAWQRDNACLTGSSNVAAGQGYPNAYQYDTHVLHSYTTGQNPTIYAPATGSRTVPVGTRFTIYYKDESPSDPGSGTVTWDAIYKMAPFTAPARGKGIAITFWWDGANWRELFRSGEIPN